jgi:hypothetical protein
MLRQLLSVLPGTQRGKLKDAAAALEELDLGDGTQLSAGSGALGYHNLNQAVPASSSKHKFAQAGCYCLTDGFTNDVHECYNWAIKAREMNIAITTFGLGNEFNEDSVDPFSGYDRWKCLLY